MLTLEELECPVFAEEEGESGFGHKPNAGEMGIDGYHQRSDQLMGSFRGTYDGTTDLPHPRMRGQHCAHREQPRQARRKNHGLGERSPDSGLVTGYGRIFAWQMRTRTRTWESQEDGSAGCFLTKGAVFWVGGNSLMSTTTLTLRPALYSKILEEGAHAKTCKHTFAFASTIAGDIHHANHSPRDQMHDMEMSRFAIDSRFCRQSSSTRCATSERKREKARRTLDNAGHTCYAEQKCSSVRLIGRKLHDGKCTNAQDTW